VSAESVAAPGATAGPVALRIEPVENRRQLDEFIQLPMRLYRGAPGYVAPLVLERRDALRKDKNPYFLHSEAQYWLARRDGRAVGRISAQIDKLYLERHGSDTGHFGFLDAEDDAALFRALTETAADWLRSRGMRRMLGPLSLSTNEECGLLIDGFDATPMMMMNFALPYVGARLAGLGFAKAKDIIAYDYEVQPAPPENIRRMAEKLATTARARVRPVDMRRYDEELKTVIGIFNDAWTENWGFVPFTETEMHHIADGMKPLIRGELVQIGELDGEPASMAVCLPNLSEAIAGLDGAVLPLGWAKILWRLKVSGLKTGRVLLMGLRREHQRSAAGTVLLFAMLEALRRSMHGAGLKHVELGWILEDNLPMRRVIEDIGGRAYKTYRIYEKAIA
jgi:hypothetical protein